MVVQVSGTCVLTANAAADNRPGAAPVPAQIDDLLGAAIDIFESHLLDDALPQGRAEGCPVTGRQGQGGPARGGERLGIAGSDHGP